MKDVKNLKCSTGSFLLGNSDCCRKLKLPWFFTSFFILHRCAGEGTGEFLLRTRVEELRIAGKNIWLYPCE